MARTIVGLDLGVLSITGTVVTVAFRGREVTGHFSRRLHLKEEGDEDPLWEARRETLSELKASGTIPPDAAITVGLPAAWASTRALTLPFSDNKKIDAALEGELDFQQTIVDVEDLATAWAHMGRTSGTGPTKVIAGTSPRARIARLIALMAELELEPQHVVHPAGGYLSLWEARNKAADDATTPEDRPDPLAGIRMLVDIGATRTNACMVDRNGNLLFARTINWGTQRCDQLISSTLAITKEEAATLRESEGRIYGRVVAPPSGEHGRMGDALLTAHAPLIQQLRVTLNTVRTDPDEPVEIWLVGGGAGLRGIERHLAGELGVSVYLKKTNALLDGLMPGAGGISEQGMLLSACLAIGAARGRRALPLDFRRGELAFAGEISWVRDTAIRVAAGMAAMIVFALGGLVVQYQVNAGMEERLIAQVKTISKRTIKRETTDPRMVLAELKNIKGPTGQTIPPYSAVDLFLLLSTKIPDSINVTFTDLELRLDKIIVKGTTTDFETQEKLVDTLKALTCVTDVRQTRSTSKGSGVEFGLTVKVECPPGTSLLKEGA